MAADSKYKETDTHLKEQFINGLNDDFINREIIKELTAINYTNSVTSRQALEWAKILEMHRSEMVMLESLRYNKGFSAV